MAGAFERFAGGFLSRGSEVIQERRKAVSARQTRIHESQLKQDDARASNSSTWRDYMKPKMEAEARTEKELRALEKTDKQAGFDNVDLAAEMVQTEINSMPSKLGDLQQQTFIGRSIARASKEHGVPTSDLQNLFGFGKKGGITINTGDLPKGAGATPPRQRKLQEDLSFAAANDKRLADAGIDITKTAKEILEDPKSLLNKGNVGTWGKIKRSAADFSGIVPEGLEGSLNAISQALAKQDIFVTDAELEESQKIEGLFAQTRQGIVALIDKGVLNKAEQKMALELQGKMEADQVFKNPVIATTAFLEASKFIRKKGQSAGQELKSGSTFGTEEVQRFLGDDTATPNITSQKEFDKLEDGATYTWKGKQFIKGQ